MFRRAFLTLVASVVFVSVLGATLPDPPRARHPAARPHLPGHRVYLTRHHGRHRVEYRISAWQVIPAANRQAAQQVARLYRTHGWATQIQQPSKGHFIVKARLTRWRLATYSAHLRTAHAVAGLLRSQGYQARVR